MIRRVRNVVQGPHRWLHGPRLHLMRLEKASSPKVDITDDRKQTTLLKILHSFRMIKLASDMLICMIQSNLSPNQSSLKFIFKKNKVKKYVKK